MKYINKWTDREIIKYYQNNLLEPTGKIKEVKITTENKNTRGYETTGNSLNYLTHTRGNHSFYSIAHII